MKKEKTFPVISMPVWLRLVEMLISKHSTAPRTRGKYKGHASTDERLWINELAFMVSNYIKARSRGRTYDNNMAVASLLGAILVSWYANVQRAKSMDPNRPLRLRRGAYAQLEKYRLRLTQAIHSDKLMGAVWGKRQAWNFSFGRGAKGGRFV